MLESMAGAMHFSMMDSKSRFWQIKMVPESQQYTAFTMGNLGFYEFIMFEHFRELKPSKCSFFQSKIVYLAHHISHKGICPSRENVHAVEEFPMPETFTQVCAFCGLVGHYRYFINWFTHIMRPLYNMLGKEVKMGQVHLPPSVALRLTLQGLGTGDAMWGLSDEDFH